MKIAITLVHNKTPEENEAQIDTMLGLVTEHTELLDGEDDEGNTVPGAFQRHYYTINGLEIPHEVSFYHVIPFQPDNNSQPYKAVLPENLYSLKGYNVQYGRGDEDKIGDHPRFFNWGLKRGTDYGAEAVLHVEDVSKFAPEDLSFQLTELIDPEQKTELVKTPAGTMSSLKLLKEAGQLDETKDKGDALVDYESSLQEKGMEIK